MKKKIYETVDEGKEAEPFKPLQNTAIDFCMRRDRAAIFARPGKGKTRIALEMISRTDCDRVLIVAPLFPALTSWPDENKKWGYNFDMRVLHGKERKVGDEFISVINYEGLEWLKATGTLDSYDMFVPDELHYLKNPGTNRFRRSRKYLNSFYFILGLTGTPLPNKLKDLWGQMYCIDGGEALGKTFTEFKRRYFTPHPYLKYEIVPNEDAEQKIFAAIKHMTIALDMQEGELPELHHVTINIPMSEQASKLYNEMKKDSIVDGTDIVAVNAAVRSGKLKQIASGVVYDQNKNIIKMHSHKTAHLCNLIKNLQGAPLLVFFEFHHDKDAIIDAIKGFTQYDLIDSSVKAEEIPPLLKRWNVGEVPVLLAQVSKAGVGGNMQFACNNLCFYTIPYGLGTFEQAVGRVWRTGQEHETMAYSLCCENTVDEDIINVVDEKKNRQDRLFEALSPCGYQ